MCWLVSEYRCAWTEVGPDLETALPFACCSWISVTGQMQSHTGAKYWLQLQMHEATVVKVMHTLCCKSAASVGTSDWLNKSCYFPVAALLLNARPTAGPDGCSQVQVSASFDPCNTAMSTGSTAGVSF